MFVNNPDAQAGWHNPQNTNQSPRRPNPSQPPTFGALPHLNEKPASMSTFEFSSECNPDIGSNTISIPTQPHGMRVHRRALESSSNRIYYIALLSSQQLLPLSLTSRRQHAFLSMNHTTCQPYRPESCNNVCNCRLRKVQDTL